MQLIWKNLDEIDKFLEKSHFTQSASVAALSLNQPKR